MASPIIPFELHLQPALPTVLGNVDYHQMREQLLRMDHLLIHTGGETKFVQGCVARWRLKCAPRRLFVHRDPKDGAYTQLIILTGDQSIAPLAAPNATFPIKSALVEK